MSHRTPPSPQLPTLTELVEYHGDAMTVRSIVPVDAGPPEQEQASTPAAEATAKRGPTAPGLLASLEGAPARAPGQALPPEAELPLRRLEAEFELQLRAALAPVFDQLLQQTLVAARRSFARAAGEIEPDTPQSADDVSTLQRSPMPPDARELSP